MIEDCLRRRLYRNGTRYKLNAEVLRYVILVCRQSASIQRFSVNSQERLVVAPAEQIARDEI